MYTRVKARIGMAKDAFTKRRELLSRKMSSVVKKKMVKTLAWVAWPVVLYGCETWTLRKEEKERLHAFEMWVWHRMERVNWKDKKSNEEVLKLVGERRSLLTTVVMRKKNWIGHVLRGSGDCLMRQVMEGGIEGVRIKRKAKG